MSFVEESPAPTLEVYGTTTASCRGSPVDVGSNPPVGAEVGATSTIIQKTLNLFNLSFLQIIGDFYLRIHEVYHNADLDPHHWSAPSSFPTFHISVKLLDEINQFFMLFCSVYRLDGMTQGLPSCRPCPRSSSTTCFPRGGPDTTSTRAGEFLKASLSLSDLFS